MSGLAPDVAAAIDDAWERRVLPALTEYTRIPCLSPAFDPDWAAGGALAQAAELLRDWVRDQDGALQAEIVQLPGRTPVLLVDNGGSGDPIVVYGHMDKQPALGTWRSGLGPYEPVREGDLLYGRGTADDGYAVFAAVTGLAVTGGGHGRVLVLIEGSEESASPDLPAYLEHLRARIGRPRTVICLDSGGLSFDRLVFVFCGWGCFRLSHRFPRCREVAQEQFRRKDGPRRSPRTNNKCGTKQGRPVRRSASRLAARLASRGLL